MNFFLDEINLKYWDKNKIHTASKSFKCQHKGYIYGDNMPSKDVLFVYKKNGKETIINELKEGTKKGYFKLVEKACSVSDITLKNFLENKAEKFRIFTAEEVASFTTSKRKSTRILDDNSKIKVKGNTYYVACNLKICEFFNSATQNIVPTELANWYIRIPPNEYYVHNDEYDEADPSKTSYMVHENGSSPVKINFDELNREKKYLGDIGELIVLNQERQRLTAAGKENLAKKVKHVSIELGDGLGYDIESYNEDGTPLYIEVKTTRYNTPFYFFMSKNEIEVSKEKQESKKKYIVRRIYNLNTDTGECNSATFKPPFDETQFAMDPTTWLIKERKENI